MDDNGGERDFMKPVGLNEMLTQRNINVTSTLIKRQLGLNKGPAPIEFQKLAEDKLVEKEVLDEMQCSIPESARSTFLMVFSPDGKKIASTHGNHNVYVTDAATGKNIQTLSGHPRTPWCIAFHPSSNQILASGCLAGQVRVWDLSGGSEIWMSDSQFVIASLAFHPIDRMLVVATCNKLYFWDWSHPEPFATCSTATDREKVRYVTFDRLGNKLITGISNPMAMASQWDRVSAHAPTTTSTPAAPTTTTTTTAAVATSVAGTPTLNEFAGMTASQLSASERSIAFCYRNLMAQYNLLVRRYFNLSRRSRTLTMDRGTDPMETIDLRNARNATAQAEDSLPCPTPPHLDADAESSSSGSGSEVSMIVNPGSSNHRMPRNRQNDNGMYGSLDSADVLPPNTSVVPSALPITLPIHRTEPSSSTINQSLQHIPTCPMRGSQSSQPTDAHWSLDGMLPELLSHICEIPRSRFSEPENLGNEETPRTTADASHQEQDINVNSSNQLAGDASSWMEVPLIPLGVNLDGLTPASPEAADNQPTSNDLTTVDSQPLPSTSSVAASGLDEGRDRPQSQSGDDPELESSLRSDSPRDVVSHTHNPAQHPRPVPTWTDHTYTRRLFLQRNLHAGSQLPARPLGQFILSRHSNSPFQPRVPLRMQLPTLSTQSSRLASQVASGPLRTSPLRTPAANSSRESRTSTANSDPAASSRTLSAPGLVRAYPARSSNSITNTTENFPRPIGSPPHAVSPQVHLRALLDHFRARNSESITTADSTTNYSRLSRESDADAGPDFSWDADSETLIIRPRENAASAASNTPSPAAEADDLALSLSARIANINRDMINLQRVLRATARMRCMQSSLETLRNRLNTVTSRVMEDSFEANLHGLVRRLRSLVFQLRSGIENAVRTRDVSSMLESASLNDAPAAADQPAPFLSLADSSNQLRELAAAMASDLMRSPENCRPQPGPSTATDLPPLCNPTVLSQLTSIILNVALRRLDGVRSSNDPQPGSSHATTTDFPAADDSPFVAPLPTHSPPPIPQPSSCSPQRSTLSLFSKSPTTTSAVNPNPTETHVQTPGVPSDASSEPQQNLPPFVPPLVTLGTEITTPEPAAGPSLDPPFAPALPSQEQSRPAPLPSSSLRATHRMSSKLLRAKPCRVVRFSRNSEAELRADGFHQERSSNWHYHAARTSSQTMHRLKKASTRSVRDSMRLRSVDVKDVLNRRLVNLIRVRRNNTATSTPAQSSSQQERTALSATPSTSQGTTTCQSCGLRKNSTTGKRKASQPQRRPTKHSRPSTRRDAHPTQAVENMIERMQTIVRMQREALNERGLLTMTAEERMLVDEIDEEVRRIGLPVHVRCTSQLLNTFRRNLAQLRAHQLLDSLVRSVSTFFEGNHYDVVDGHLPRLYRLLLLALELTELLFEQFRNSRNASLNIATEAQEPRLPTYQTRSADLAGRTRSTTTPARTMVTSLATATQTTSTTNVRPAVSTTSASSDNNFRRCSVTVTRVRLPTNYRPFYSLPMERSARERLWRRDMMRRTGSNVAGRVGDTALPQERSRQIERLFNPMSFRRRISREGVPPAHVPPRQAAPTPVTEADSPIPRLFTRSWRTMFASNENSDGQPWRASTTTTPTHNPTDPVYYVPLVRVNDVPVSDTNTLNTSRPIIIAPHVELDEEPSRWRYFRPRFLHPRYSGPNPFDDQDTDNNEPPSHSPFFRYFNTSGMYVDPILISDSPLSTHHRIQAWDFTNHVIPNIADREVNGVVAECKIHNDASVDVSADGTLLVTLLPSGRLSVTTMLGVYSLNWKTLGQLLYKTGFEQNAVSVSLSPTARHLLVGLASRPLGLRERDRTNMAQIFKLGGGWCPRGVLKHARDLEQSREMSAMSLNCIRWAPGPGCGLVYGTNTGQLVVLR